LERSEILMSELKTIQSNIKNANDTDWTKYSLFLGGLDVSANALQQYDPQRTGYARIFVVRKPTFLEKVFGYPGNTDLAKKFKSFWHMIEYGFIGIDGIQNTSLEFETLTGGYAGRSMELPTLSRDETNAITIRVYEMAGSPIREFIDTWITGIADPHTGLTHYHGAKDENGGLLKPSQYHQTAEMIYVNTDSTGNSGKIEYACLLANMVPKIVKKDHYNYESGSHPLVQYDIEFTATRYESLAINDVAKKLVEKHSILSNYTYFRPKNYIDGTNDNALSVSSTISNRENSASGSWSASKDALTK
jgi:hypothetical protein